MDKIKIPHKLGELGYVTQRVNLFFNREKIDSCRPEVVFQWAIEALQDGYGHIDSAPLQVGNHFPQQDFDAGQDEAVNYVQGPQN